MIRAWNIRTGALVWTFNLVAQPGDPDTRPGKGRAGRIRAAPTPGATSRSTRHAASSSFPTRCRDRTTTTVGPGPATTSTAPRSLPSTRTGKLRWHQQLVHHDIWDYDLGAAPTLVDVVKNGKTIPAVAQITKMGLLFIFDRMTGEPVFGIEERPVPQSTAPGEKTSPTQPFPVKPPPLARNSMTKADLADNHSRARGVLQRAVGEVRAPGLGAVHAVGRQARHRRCFPAPLAAATGTASPSTRRWPA